MSILNTISSASGTLGVGGSALSLVGQGLGLVFGQSLKKGIEGFLFDIDLEASVDFSSQVTDHYVEDNSAVQDHIALAPITITLSGKIGELVHTKDAGTTFLRAMVDRLGAVDILKPSQSASALRAISTYERVSSAYDSITTNLSTITDAFRGGFKNKQQDAFAKMEELWKGRTLCSVETPWRTYQNMVIESFSAKQDDTNIMETTFTVNFKQIKYIETSIGIGSIIGRIAEQKAPVVNKGTQSGTKDNRTGTAALFDSIFKGTK